MITLKYQGIGDLFEKVSLLETEEEKIALLQSNFSSTLADIIKLAYHPAAVWDLPEGAPPYSPNTEEHLEHVLYSEIKKMYIYLKGGSPNLNHIRRESLFIEMLSNLAPKDADLMILVKDKKLPHGITYELVHKAFPELLPEPTQ